MKRFWSGAITHMAVLSLFQDFMGKEEYLRRVDANWVSGDTTVTLAFLLLALAGYLFAGERK